MVRKRELEVFMGKILPALRINGVKTSIMEILKMAVEHKIPKGILGLDEEMSKEYNRMKRDLRSKE